MKTDIQSRNFPLSDEMHQHIARRLQFALGRIETNVRHVTVRVEDVNGPRGGLDKQCHIHVALNNAPDVVIEELQADLFVAVQRAADRVGRVVVRRIGKQRHFSHDAIPNHLQAE